VVALVFLEVAAIILLFGAQAIAEYERMQQEQHDLALIDPDKKS
jgi:uncharacterized BrkB/YihY/UPF0761 family membrane protein